MSRELINILVFAVYFIALIGIGIWTSRKLNSSADFIIGGRSIGPWVSAISFLAAYFSSVVIIGGGGFGYKFGFATLWIGAINVLLGCTLAWIVLGKRIRAFTTRLNTMTIPGFLSERFQSPFSRYFSAVIIALLLIVYNVSVLKGMGDLLNVTLKLDYIAGVIIAGIIIIFYVMIGGYMAVVWTGLIQGIIMIAGLLLLSYFTIDAVGGIDTAVAKINSIVPEGMKSVSTAHASHPLIDTPGVWGWEGLISFALIVSFGVWGMPQLLARFYSIKSLKTLKVGTVVVTIGGAMAILPYLNGTLARVFFETPPAEWIVNGKTNYDLAIPYLIEHVMPNWATAIFIAGVISAGMSTFSAVLIIISSSLMKDVYEDGLKRKLNPKKSLMINKVVSGLFGLVSLIIALNPPGLVLTLTAFAWAIISSACLWPILFAIYSKRTTKTAIEMSMVIGSVTALVWMLLGKPFGLHGFIPGVLISFLTIIIVNLFTKKLPQNHIKAVWGE